MTQVTYYPAGSTPEPEAYEPGDFFLVCDWHEDVLGKLIQAGARVRYGNVDLARWSHSGMIVSIGGSIVEAEAQGNQLNDIAKYKDADLYVVSPEASDEQRNLAVAYAKSQIGDPYDVLDFVGLALQIVTGSSLSVHRDGSFICSELVARCTEKYIVGYPRSVECMMPSDLAAYWGVHTEQPLPSEGLFDKFLNAVAFVTKPLRGVKRGVRWLLKG